MSDLVGGMIVDRRWRVIKTDGCREKRYTENLQMKCMMSPKVISVPRLVQVIIVPGYHKHVAVRGSFAIAGRTLDE